MTQGAVLEVKTDGWKRALSLKAILKITEP
jgi:hypothetical protein